jgi:hypothetical protein
MFKVNEEDFSVESVNKVNFSEIGWTEPNEIESMVANNLEKFVGAGGKEENLIVIGRQVRDKSRGRNDIVALDGEGNIVLIEIKRDIKDSKSRRENIESQAVRYAAALAKIESPRELLSKMYSEYYSRYEEGGEDQEEGAARKKLYDFLETNDIEFGEINRTQRIVLFASGYSERALSSLAWLSKNGVSITVLKGSLFKHGGELMLDVEQLLPVVDEEEYFIDIPERDSATTGSSSRSRKPRVGDMMDEGLLAEGDKLRIPTDGDHPDSVATLLDENHVEVNGEKRSTNQWAKEVKGWDSVSIYREVEHVESGKLLNQLRRELE